MELLYDVDVKAILDDLRKTGIIEGQAINSSVNKNRWQVPDATWIILLPHLRLHRFGLIMTKKLKPSNLVTKTKRLGDAVFLRLKFPAILGHPLSLLTLPALC